MQNKYVKLYLTTRAQKLSATNVSTLKYFICVAPIMQYTQVHNKNSNTQGSSPNVVKVIFHTLRNCS